MNPIKLYLACIILIGFHAVVWVTNTPSMASETTASCFLLEDFEDTAWRNSWDNNHRSFPSIRCKLAAHDGNYGLLNFGRWYYNTEVPLLEGNTRLGAWVFLPKNPSPWSSVYLGFGATDEGTLAFKLTSAEVQLVSLSDGYKSSTESVLHTEAFAATSGEWHRIEIDFPSLTEVHARVFDESAHLLLDLSIQG